MRPDVLFHPPASHFLAVILLIGSSVSLVLSLHSFESAYHCAAGLGPSLWVVRGLRFLVIALACLSWSAGIFWGYEWLLIIGLIIIGQELYEMALLSVILKKGLRMEN